MNPKLNTQAMSIAIKLKPCSVCGIKSRLWKASPPMCKNCAMIAYADKAQNKPFKPLKQTTDGKVAKVFKISPISTKRAQELKVYRVERDKYFIEHPVCEYPGCTCRDIELHHAKGRCGKLLTDPRFFKSLCNKHHTWVTNNNDAAMELGLVESRLATTY